jgi:hypothetical protein
MGLRGRLSNPEFKDLLQSLTSLKDMKVPAKRTTIQHGKPDGRRSFGSVGRAIQTVFEEAGGEMRVRDIHAGVERKLGGMVSFNSVADFLLRRSNGPKPLFVRVGYGHYRRL